MQEDVRECKESALQEEKWHLEGRRGLVEFSRGGIYLCWVCEDGWELDGVGGGRWGEAGQAEGTALKSHGV